MAIYPSSSKKNEFKAVLRRAGYKATLPRLAILELIKRSRRPLSAQDIIAKLEGKTDKVTVYRFIAKLKNAGIVRQIDLRQNNAQYEFFDSEDHHHVVCARCGRIEDIGGCEIDHLHNVILKEVKNFSEVSQHSLEFYGICLNCAKSKNFDKVGSQPKNI